MDDMTINEPDEGLEEICVEAFLAPLAEVPPASRTNGRRRAQARFRRVAILAVLLVGAGAGIAVAANSSNEPVATVIDTNGNTTTVPLQQVPAPGADCQDPSCVPGETSPVTAPPPPPPVGGSQAHEPQRAAGHR